MSASDVIPYLLAGLCTFLFLRGLVLTGYLKRNKKHRPFWRPLLWCLLLWPLLVTVVALLGFAYFVRVDLLRAGGKNLSSEMSPLHTDKPWYEGEWGSEDQRGDDDVR